MKKENKLLKIIIGISLVVVMTIAVPLATGCAGPSQKPKPTPDSEEQVPMPGQQAPTPEINSETQPSLMLTEGISYEGELNMTQSNEKTERQLNIDFLYLDLGVCSPCQGTEAVLDQAISDITPILEEVGFEITVNKTHIQSVDQARDLGFASSPTIRVNGHDIQPDIVEKPCISCGDLCGNPDVCCRVWTYNGEESWAPSKAMIIDAILHEAYGFSDKLVDSKPPTGDVPENIKLFFTAKEESKLPDNDACCDSSSRCCP